LSTQLPRTRPKPGALRRIGVSANRTRPVLECLEDRLMPSASSDLLPLLYGSLLNRQPDYPGASGYAAQLDSGVSAAAVAYEIETAPTHEYYLGLVQSYYVHFLNRLGSTQELQGYVSQLVAGSTNEQVEAQFLGSQEYFRLHGSDNTAWLNGVYRDLLGRPDSEGAHLNELSGGISRQMVAWNIMYGPGKEFATHQVMAYYQQFLGCSGQGDRGLDNFATELQLGQMTDEGIIAALLGSTEHLAWHQPVLGTPASGSR
jgi:hypothetical protein